MHWQAMNRHILVSHFGHVASLAWARMILGRFRDAVLPDFRPTSGSGAFFTSFYILTLVVGYTAVYMFLLFLVPY